MRDSPRHLLLCELLLISILAGAVFPSSAKSESSPEDTILLPSDRHDSICARASPAPACPVTCFRPDPVCGEDGVTYWCGCPDAACHGVHVAKLGFCNVGSGGNGLLSGQALLLVHIVWLIVLAFSVAFGLF